MAASKCGNTWDRLISRFEADATHVLPRDVFKEQRLELHRLDVDWIHQLASNARRAPQRDERVTPITQPPFQARLVDRVRTRQSPMVIIRPRLNFQTHLASWKNSGFGLLRERERERGERERGEREERERERERDSERERAQSDLSLSVEIWRSIHDFTLPHEHNTIRGSLFAIPLGSGVNR